jgi:hypothetical protein
MSGSPGYLQRRQPHQPSCPCRRSAGDWIASNLNQVLNMGTLVRAGAGEIMCADRFSGPALASLCMRKITASQILVFMLLLSLASRTGRFSVAFHWEISGALYSEHPCRSAKSSPCRVSRGLIPSSERALPGASKKRGRCMRPLHYVRSSLLLRLKLDTLGHALPT